MVRSSKEDIIFSIDAKIFQPLPETLTGIVDRGTKAQQREKQRFRHLQYSQL
jgi:hypothetical protein